MKKVLLMFIAVLLLFSSLTDVFAETSVGEHIDAELIADKIAANVPSSFGYDYSWELVQKTPLYDIGNKIIAYCYDFVNMDTELLEADTSGIIPETSYVVVNCTDVGDPILMFGVYGVSPYLNSSYDKLYYLGAMQYYGVAGEKYYDLKTNAAVSYDLLCTVDQSYKIALSSSEIDIEEIREIRNSLVGNKVRSAPKTIIGSNTVSGAANLQWTRGCAPTTIAMLLKTRYVMWNGTQMIYDLADCMQVSESVAADFLNITLGTLKYIDIQSNMTRPDVYGWACPNSSGVPLVGFTYNSKEGFKQSIDSGHPVGVYINSSTVITNGFPSGIGAHMMSGIGYSFTSAGDYIICYTTVQSDGQVYFPCTSTGLQNHAWFYLIWG